MSPILGIIASGISSSKAITGSFESIATANGTGSSGTITFSSIPSTYSHLQIRAFAHSTRTAGTDAGITMTVNSDSGSSYSRHILYGNGSTVTASAASSTTTFYNYDITADNGNSSTYTAFIIDFLNYADGNKYKTLRSLHGFDKNGSGQIALVSGNWRSISAISSVSFVTDNYFTTATNFALYGIKS
jgi:hypothetical protein